MRSFWLCAALFLFCVPTSSCASEIYDGQALESYPAGAAADAGILMERQVRLSMNEHPLLDPLDVVLDGCRRWHSTNVDCVLTDMFDSDIHLVAVSPEDLNNDDTAERRDLVNCVSDEDGKRTLGVAFGGPGDFIEIYTKCYEIVDAAGNVTGYDTQMATAVVTHEVGHQFGIWEHVPAECTPQSYVVQDGRRLCGDAIMNASLNLDRAAGPTEVDRIAYELYAPFDPTNPPQGGASCAFKH